MQAYLPPSTSGPALRRGSFVELVQGPPEALALIGVRAGGAAWTTTGTASYAEVAVEGRALDQIIDDRDVNRPFRVIGTIDDVDLSRLVKFVRSRPVGPTRGGVQPTGRVHGEWPILAVARDRESYQVRISKADFEFEVVLLQRTP